MGQRGEICSLLRIVRPRSSKLSQSAGKCEIGDRECYRSGVAGGSGTTTIRVARRGALVISSM